MKIILLLTPLLLILILACTTSNHTSKSVKKLEIVKTDFTRDYFVFNTKNESGIEVIVLAEKKFLTDCQPFKKYIIADSIHETSILKAGEGKDFVGYNLSIIDGIKIKNDGELPKIILNCNCFTSK